MVHEEAHHQKTLSSSSRLSRTADNLNSFIESINRFIACIGAAALGGLVLMLIYSIIGRRLLNAPLPGSFELTELGLIIITFTVVGYEMLGHEKMTVDIFTRYFPQKMQSILAPVIFFLALVILGILCWQMVKQGIRVQGFHQTTRVLQIPIFPFLYLAAFGIFTLIPVYIVKLLKALDKAVTK